MTSEDIETGASQSQPSDRRADALSVGLDAGGSGALGLYPHIVEIAPRRPLTGSSWSGAINRLRGECARCGSFALGPAELRACPTCGDPDAAIEPALEAAPRAVFIAVAAEPVAYRVKDFADGWIYYSDDEAHARKVAADMGGALVEPLYSANPAEVAK